MLVHGAGEEDASGLNASEVVCSLSSLDVPTAVLQQMAATRALDGRQEASWGTDTASWSYHPDQGLDVIVTTS